MKTILAFVTAASLIVNAAMVYFLVNANRAESESSAQSATGPTVARSAPAISQSIWPSLHNDDIHTTIAQLKAAGFPSYIIRAIVAAQLQAPYAAKLKALLEERSSHPYWKNAVFNDPKLMAELRELSRDQRKALNDLLGPDDEQRTSLFDSRNFTFLPAEKAAQVHRLLDDFDQRRSDLLGGGPFDQTKMQALEKEQHDAIAAVLTPEELLQYDLRNSNTARSLRERLAAFDPSEQEFQAIYKLQAAFDQQYQMAPGMLPQDFRQRAEAQRQLTDQIKAMLTPDRAAIYDRATDYNYATTTRLMSRLELPPETANTLYDVQKEFEQRRSDVFQNAGMSAEQRNAALTALQQEAITRVTPILGSTSALEAYKQYGGTWLRSLVPQTRRTLGPVQIDSVNAQVRMGGG